MNLVVGDCFGGPFAGVPPKEIGDAAEEFIHPKGYPAAGQTKSKADAKKIREEYAHGPAGYHRNNHGINDISGTS